jgi:hypothetical protein
MLMGSSPSRASGWWGAGEVGVEHASYGLQASRCDDQRNRLNHSLCVFRRALGGGDGEVPGRQIDSLDRLGSPAAASDVANSTFRQFLFRTMDRVDDGVSAQAVVAPHAGARC